MNSYENNTQDGQNDLSRSVPGQETGPSQPVSGQEPLSSQAQHMPGQEARPTPPPVQDPGNPYAGWQQTPPRRESPYANSPYANSPYMNQNSQDTWGNPVYPPKPPKQKKPKGSNPWGKRILAGSLVVALVAAGSGITALCMNNHWSSTMAHMHQEYDSQLSALEKKIQETANQNLSSPAGSNGYLSPTQVYAKNVGSVVAISSTMGQNMLGQVAQGSGSGFILSPNGYIATNCHVVEGAVSVSVITGDNTEYPAKILGKDPANDVAILKIEAQGLPAVTIGNSNDLMIGDMVVAIGNPLGELTATQTVGYICGKDRTVSTGGAPINMLQTDAAINAGNSGGPLFNMKGEVIGITTAKYSGTVSGGASIEGIGFAIPIDDILGIMNDLARNGYVTGPYLGVSVRDVDPQIAATYNIPLGANVVEVVEGASADRAGIEPKDIITRLGEYNIKNSNDLIRALRHYEAGDTVSITFSRSGASHTVKMELDEKPRQTEAPSQQPQQEAAPSQDDYDEFQEYMDKFFHDFFGTPRP